MSDTVVAGDAVGSGSRVDVPVGSVTASDPRAARSTPVIVALGLATFVSALDTTVVNVALPQIQRDLRLTTSSLEWVFTAYVLVFASLVFLGGRSADRIGRRATFVAGLTVFAVASAAAAAAPGAGLLIAARAVQGLGGALLLPASLSILGGDVSPRARQLGAGIATAAAAAALALGPVLGGVISEHWAWNGIFLVNLPIVAVCLALTWWAVPKVPPTVARGPVGVGGVLTSGLAMSAVVWLLIEGGRQGWDSPLTVAVIGVGAVSAVWFVALAAAGRAAVVDRVLAGNRVFVGAILASTLWGLGVNGVFFYTSLVMQNVLHIAPVDTGLAFVPLAAALIVVVAVVGRVVTRLGESRAISLGLVVVAVGLTWVSLIGPSATVTTLLPGLVLVGAGSGLTVPLTAVALGAVDPTRLGMASSLITASREVAGAFGVAGIGAVVAAREAALHLAGRAPDVAFLGGYQWGLRVGAALVLLGAVCTATLLRGRCAPR